MRYFKTFYLDKEKDIIVDLYKEQDEMSYILRTPNHGTGNLITNLAELCSLPLSFDENGLKIIKGTVPCYIDAYNRTVYIFRLGNTKCATIYPDGTIEMKASIPAISKTLMSQTKDYHLGIEKTIIKSYILNENKFHTDLHTHMNANLKPDILIALGIHHQIRYPYYYIKKLNLKCTEKQITYLETQRKEVQKQYQNSSLTGKYLERRINDNTFINFADLILGNIKDSDYNIAKIRSSLAVMKDGQAVFTNLEKVYLYRYVFTKGIRAEYTYDDIQRFHDLTDQDIASALSQMEQDRESSEFRNNTLFQDKLLWIARNYASQGVTYAEISDTSLVKPDAAPDVLRQIHEVMPAVTEKTGVTLRFLAALRRIPLTIVRDRITPADYSENLRVIRAIASDPYVAGSDIVGEEINDIRELSPVLKELAEIAEEEPSFVIRIHAGENDSLRDNVASSVLAVKDALKPGQKMPHVRIGHGLYTASLRSEKGRQLIQLLQETGTVLEFQITSNVRLNNLNSLQGHPLKQYLKENIRCVQGTDGGALYGTDSMDEQLSLEKLLSLSYDEMHQMKETEDRILQTSMKAFREKEKKLKKLIKDTPVSEYYRNRIDQADLSDPIVLSSDTKQDAASVFKDRIREVPRDKTPIVIAGGSFNSDRHRTRMHPEGKALIRKLLDSCDPDKVCFIIGHSMSAYERYLTAQNKGRFEIYAFVPSAVSEEDITRISKQNVFIRVSIESAVMGLYKSVAFEIFKQRNSILIAFDGNSPAQNMIQEANNAKYECRIFVDQRAKSLHAKAGQLQGYVTVFAETDDTVRRIMQDLRKIQKRD
ncbi:MAG TPA: adenosine deaminase [Erysipelotrichaceae bacterium]|nr:adenosine deaminase [Erysipelotrichaceae bacterium]